MVPRLPSNSFSICLTVSNARVAWGPHDCLPLSFQAHPLFMSDFFGSSEVEILGDCVLSRWCKPGTPAAEEDGKHRRLTACLGYRASSQHISENLFVPT